MLNNKIIGDWGENFAREYLVKKGYKFVAKNVKISNQELDLIFFYQKKLIVVEVKTKTSERFGSAVDMVNSKKIRNLKLGTLRYIKNENLQFTSLRLDLLTLDLNRVAKTVKVKHYKDII